MLYGKSITIPKSTTSTSPTKVTLGISAGVITKIMVRPRPGHSALAHLVIRYQTHQIAPSTEGMELHGDKDPIDWEDYVEVSQPPFELVLEGWNDDDTYEHTFDVYVAVIPKSLTLGQILSNTSRDIFSLLSPRRIFGGGG